MAKEIHRAKEEAWRELLKEIDEDQWSRPYKVVMNRLRSTGPGLTETLDENILERLVKKLFPRETEEKREELVRVEAWKKEWNITIEETCNIISNKRKNTAPGPDGITSRMWRKVPRRMIEEITKIMNKLLKIGIFPRKWKIARLVLIPKGKNEEVEIPKARPICLINNIGKYLEKILVDRIEKWMEYQYERGCAFRAIGKNQYGFRRNMSTIDALDKVKDIVEKAKKEGDIAVIVCLDIENAFNSIP